MEPTIYENDYLKVVDYLEKVISFSSSDDYRESDDYAMGFSEGKKELATELLIQMQKTVIGWKYGQGERNGSI